MRQLLHALFVEDNGQDLFKCALIVACLFMGGDGMSQTFASAIASSFTIIATTR